MRRMSLSAPIVTSLFEQEREGERSETRRGSIRMMRAMVEGNLPPRKALEEPLLYAREDVKLGGVGTKRGRDAERQHRPRV